MGKRMEAREIPFPRVCPDCFHEECEELAKAWRLLTDAEQADAS